MPILHICAKFELYNVTGTQINGHSLKPPIKIRKISMKFLQKVNYYNFRLG